MKEGARLILYGISSEPEAEILAAVVTLNRNG